MLLDGETGSSYFFGDSTGIRIIDFFGEL